MGKKFFTDAVGRVVSVGVVLLATLVWAWPLNNSAGAVARAQKVEICHRTRSTTNPYRRITVSKNAAKNGHKANHTGSVWVNTRANGDTWGDIIPDKATDNSNLSPDPQLNYSGTGLSIYTRSSGYENACRAMTAKEFVRVHFEAGGSLSSAMTELDDMAAGEDDALRQALGSTFSSWYTSLGSPTSLTTLESQIDTKNPSVTTNDASSVAGTSATLNGSVLPRSVALSVYFEYGTSSTLSSVTEATSGMTLNGTAGTSIASGNTGTVTAALTLTGLTSGTTYYYRLVALATSGTSDSAVDTLIYGDIVPFTLGTDEQTIDFPTVSSKPYGSTFSVSATSKNSSSVATGLTVTFTSLDTAICTVGSSSISSNVSSATVTPVSVGTCPLKATQAGGGSSPVYKAAPAVSQNITISAKGITISSGVAASNKEFNDSDSATVTCSSPTLSGVETDDASLVSVSCSSPSGTFSDKHVADGKSVTVSGVSLTGGRSNRYSLTISGVTANITVKSLVVTAANKSKTVGDPDPTWTVSGSGLQGSDALDDSTTTYTFTGTGSTSYTASTTPPSAVGTYSITPSAAAFSTGRASNYSISYSPGTYEILALGAATTSSSTTSSSTTSSSTTAAPTTTAAPSRGTTTTSTTVVATATSTTTTVLSRRITICHRTMAGTFVEITVDRNSLGGHGQHGTDIIPAPADGCGRQAINELLSTTTTLARGRITICHRTMAGTFVEITVDRNSLGGHANHGTDIIPAPIGGCGVLTQSNEPEPEPSGQSTSTTALSRRITICHRTMAGTFVEITVDRNSLGGHGQHGTDIIPAPEGGCGQESVDALLATTTTLARGRITICHRTMAGTFVEITVDRNSLGGHDNHETDIIPAPIGGCDVLGTRPNGGGGGGNSNTTSAEPRRITICHWNASDSYVQITVDANGLNGHGDHPNDIIPAPAGGCGRSSVQRVLSSTTTTTVAPGSLEDTKQKLDEERKGGKDKSVLDVVNLNSEPKPGGGGGGGGGGTIEIEPKKDGPGVQLLDAKTNDPDVKVVVKSSGSDYNKPQTWVNEGFGSFCWKLEPFNGEYTYTLPSPPNPPDARYAGLAYSAVIVKAGSVVESDPAYQANTVFMNPAPGSVVWPDVNKNGILDPGGQGGGTLGDKAISHIVICVGDSAFPQVLTTTTTSVPGGTTTTTLAGATTTTLAGSTTSAPLRTTTTTLRSTTTTARPRTTTTLAPSIQQSTTTVRVGATTLAPSIQATTTTVRGATSTTTATSGTTQPGAPTTTASATATTQPGAPSTTVPPGTTPPIVIELEVPEDGFTKQSAVVVELLISTGSQTEVAFLSVDMRNFSVGVPQQVVVLPATGVQATGNSGVFAQAVAGLGALLAGVLLLFGRSRRRSL